jgi:predicted metal-binding protein
MLLWISMKERAYPKEAEKLLKRSIELGASVAKIIRSEDIVVGEWVRLKCQYGCGGYGKRLTCPPYSPTPSQIRDILKEYSWGILLSFEGDKGAIHETVASLEAEAFLAGYYKAFGLGTGPCPFCEKCNLQSCLHPQKARPSMEACGIDVYATARRAGFKIDVIKSREERPTFFAMVLIE